MTTPFAGDTQAARSGHHHGSHRKLLDEAPITIPDDVDAIIVPTARSPSAIKHAIALAGKLNSTLVVLCSKRSSTTAIAQLVKRKGVKLIAIDADKIPAGVLPRFATCKLLANTRFRRNTDTSLKRNLGLLIATLIGWERVVFLDDDIVIDEPMDLRDAAGLTDDYAGVGLSIGGYPDNSVVCHAYREAGGHQDMFIGGGALAIGAKSMTSFFPNIYNEDWFFLLGDEALRPTTITGTAIQKDYDPFADPDRARREEFGDCLAEGLFWLLDTGGSIKDAHAGHWRRFLAERAGFIADVISMVQRMDVDPLRRAKMLTSLEAAREWCRHIWPGLCDRYVHAWQADRARWQRHVNALQTHVAPKNRGDRRSPFAVREMFRSLGLKDETVYLSLPHESLD